MALAIGSSGEAYTISKDLLISAMNINQACQKGKQLTRGLEGSAKYNGYQQIVEMEEGVERALKAAIPQIEELATQIKAYGDYLAGLE